MTRRGPTPDAPDSACPPDLALARFVEAPGDAPEVGAHLETCPACAARVEELGLHLDGPLGEGVGMALLFGDPAPGVAGGPAPGETAHPTGLARADAEDLAPGTRVGRYVVLEVIGRGGMGVVYSANDPDLDRRVAIKLVKPHVHRSTQGQVQARLLREAQIMARLSSPHVVSVFDVGTLGEAVYLVMERVEGITVKDWLEHPRSWGECLRVFTEAARGLAAAHALGIVHRDFKPSNVLVRADGRVQVTDFGLAKSEDASTAGLTGTGAVLGTPAYMAPEQAFGGAGPSSDQFSFCIALYEALYRQAPFPHRTSLAQLPAASEPPPDTDVPPSLARALRRGLAVSPAERFASMEELLLALRLDAPTLPDRPRIRGVKAGAAMACALAAVSGGLWLWRRPTAASLLEPPGSILACPPLTANGPPASRGWLGAAAASLACARAAARLGGSTSRIRVPADLLDLSPIPTPDYPADPYSAPEARQKAVAAANARSTVVLDGDVQESAEGFEVALSSRTSGGRELGAGRGRDPLLYRAVGKAVADLTRHGGLPDRTELDPEIQRWLGVTRVSSALALLDMIDAEASEDVPTDREECARLPALTDFKSPGAVGMCQAQAKPGERAPPLPAPGSDGPELGWQTLTRTGSTNDLPPDAVADLARRLGVLRQASSDPSEGAWLATAESTAELAMGDSARAHESALWAARLDPRQSLGTERLWRLVDSTAQGEGAHRAAQAWAPADPYVWAMRAPYDASGSDPQTMERAFTLAPLGSWAVHYGSALIDQGRLEEARWVVARSHSVTLQMKLEAARAQFESALQIGERELALAMTSSFDLAARLDLLPTLLDCERILGRPPGAVEGWLTRLLDAQPASLQAGMLARIQLIGACSQRGSPISRRCLQTLRRLSAQGAFNISSQGLDKALEGSERYVEGDVEGAARAWRPLTAEPGPLTDIMAEPLVDAFERAGEPELAERLDGWTENRLGRYNGASLASVREAHRALERGQLDKARRLAIQVIQAWSVADERVPAVADMRDLIAKLDHR